MSTKERIIPNHLNVREMGKTMLTTEAFTTHVVVKKESLPVVEKYIDGNPTDIDLQIDGSKVVLSIQKDSYNCPFVREQFEAVLSVLKLAGGLTARACRDFEALKHYAKAL